VQQRSYWPANVWGSGEAQARSGVAAGLLLLGGGRRRRRR
jgi:hypothetical protein